MTTQPPRPPRRPYWLLAAFAVMLVAPAWTVPVLVGTALAAMAWRAASAVAQRSARTPDPAGGILLGADERRRGVVLRDRELSAHGLILGASGAGKSTTLLRVLSEHIERGRPVVAIDLKGSPAFARQLADAATAAGRRIRIWTPDGQAHWNPLQHGNPTELKDKLISTERFTEPHYQRAAERYVQTVLQVLQEANPKRSPTLAQVVRLMDPQQLPAVLRGVPKPFADRVLDYLAGLTPDQVSAVRGLGTRLAILTESHTGRYLEPAGAGNPAIDLHRALAGDEVVLFSLNSSTYGKLSAQIGTLVVQDLVSAAGHRLASGGGPPAIVALDEFSALGADHVISLLARGREAGVSVLLATQELADLDRAAPGLRDQVLGNTAIKLVHRQEVPSSAQTIAQIAGTEHAWEDTHQLGSNLLGGYRTGRGTRRQVERFVVDPNDIKTLGTGDVVMISKLSGQPPRRVHVSRPPQRTEREL